jgi:SAM-dependent methyltransferase
MLNFPHPPAELIEYVSGNVTPEQSLAIGRYHVGTFVESAGLKPDDRILDVGCGIGRVAVALSEFLSPNSRYEGFDISERAIDWCRENITPLDQRFHFQHTDLYNDFYNPNGTLRARRYWFPFGDGTFDFAYLTSVFTHMLPVDLTQYAMELSRVLKRGGRCVMTFFLHDRETASLIRQGRSTFQLPCSVGRSSQPIGADPRYGECFTETAQEVERVVAYETQGIVDLLALCGFSVKEILPGTWSGKSGPGFQDVIVLTKTGEVSPRLHLRRALRMEWLREWTWRIRKRFTPRIAFTP